MTYQLLSADQDSLSKCSTIVPTLASEKQEEQKQQKYFVSPRFTATYLTREAIEHVQKGSYEISPSDLIVSKMLGEGQFGVVYKGSFQGQTCAVKMLKKGVSNGVEYERLLLEISILAGVGYHPNLVCFLGACLQDGKPPMIVEEFVRGPDLEEYLNPKMYEFDLGQPTVSATCGVSASFQQITTQEH